MSQLIFRYKSEDIIYNYRQDETLPLIFQSFSHQIGVKRDNLCFLCNGEKLSDTSTIEGLIPNQENKIIILVNDLQSLTPDGPIMKKSDNIVCPKCKESAIISIKDYKISFSQCKNGHMVDNILLSKFNETQEEDISQILCGICKQSKSKLYGNKMTICTNCKINLCLLCKTVHDDTHNIINYEEKNYICEKDGEYYTSYCKSCKKSICSICENDHDSHEIITFGKLIGNRNELIKQHEKLKNDIDKFKILINNITIILNKVSKNIDIYFDINKTIINATLRRIRNSEELLSLNIINNNTIHNDINKIINDAKINNQINGIFEMYKKMENIDQINFENNLENADKNDNDVNINSNNQNSDINIINNETIISQNNNLSQNNQQNESNNNINNINNIRNNNINNNDNIINNENNIIINDNNNNSNNETKITNIINHDNNQNNNISTNNEINKNIINNSNNNQLNTNTETNNNIEANNNNNINTPNNTNQNSIQVTPGIDSSNINNNNNPNTNIDSLNNILNAEIENIIREDIEKNTPLISDILPITLLIDEFINNQQYIDSVKQIANKYQSIRKIRRDGNCFYRGFIYRIFEYICMNNISSLYEKMLKKIDEAKELAKKNILVASLIDDFYNVFIGEFCSCYNSLTNTNTSCRDYLDKLFQDENKEKCNYLILFVKYTISEYLRENKLMYESFIEGDFDNWLVTEVESIDKEAEQMQIIACVTFFDIGVKIEYLNKVKNEVIKFPEDKDEKDIFINLLFFGGHYDLLYK